MTTSRRRLYDAITIRCDNCRVEETSVLLVQEPPDSPHQLPLVRGWMPVPFGDTFSRGEPYHACSRACADAIVARALDATVAAAR